MRKQIKHIAEYLAVSMTGWLANILPYRMALSFGWLNAGITFHVLRFRRKLAESRISTVFDTELEKHRPSRIAWISWRNIMFNGVELMRVSKATLPWIRSIMDCQPIDILLNHSKTGRGAILACPHAGNWELGAITCHLHGIPIFTVTGNQSNQLVDGYINRLRRKPGIDTIPRGAGTMRVVLQKLKEGKVLALLPDVRDRQPAVSVPFLGAQANVPRGMALFAKQTNVPIFPCIMKRYGWTRHVLKVYPPIWPDDTLDKGSDVLRMTRLVFNIIDNVVRQEPEQWFWFNKRWILDPVEEQTAAMKAGKQE